MKKLLFIALVALSSIGAFAQSRTGSTTIQPKIGLNVSTVGDLDWKAGFVFGAEIQHQFTSKMGLAGGLLYSFQGGKHDDYSWNPGYLNNSYNTQLLCGQELCPQGRSSARIHGQQGRHERRKHFRPRCACRNVLRV